MGTIINPPARGAPADPFRRVMVQQQDIRQQFGFDTIGGWLMQHELQKDLSGGLPILTVRNLGKLPRFDSLRSIMGDLSKPLTDAMIEERARAA
jgi:hypothetical protein